jgi:transcriptional regulator with XRE-family HTH domain
MKRTNFGRYLDKQLGDPGFAARFKRAGEAWDVALQIAALREQAGLSQKDLAKLVKTSQQQISRLESPSYEGHSLSMLRRVADVLHARIRVVFEPANSETRAQVAERPAAYRNHRDVLKRELERNLWRRESEAGAFSLQRPGDKDNAGAGSMGVAKMGRKLLETIVRHILTVTEAEKIILFGSAVRGEMGPDSDLDILVVTACDHRRDTARQIRRALFGIAVPIDIIVAKPQDLERYGDSIGLIYRPALREGTVLYAA